MNQIPSKFATLFFITIIVEILVVFIAAVPTNRHHRRLIIDNKTVANDCITDYPNSSRCRSGAKTIGADRHGDDGDDANTKVEEERKLSNIMELSNNANYNDDNAVEEGRKKKKKGMGRVLLMLAAAMKATLLYAMIHGVAIVAGKALVVAKIALALAAAVALKKSLEHSDKTSYEIVKHPQHSYAQTHSSSIDYEHHGGFEGHRRRRKRRYVR